MGLGYNELWKQLNLFVDKKINYYENNKNITHDEKHEAMRVLKEIKRFMDSVETLTIGW